MKVLHLIDSGGLYGAEKMLLSLCKYQIDTKIPCCILSCGVPDEAEKPIEKEAKTMGIPIFSIRMEPGLNYSGMKKVWEFISTENFNVLHSHGYKFNILLALTKPVHSNVKILNTAHGYLAPKPWSKLWVYYLLDKLSRIRLDATVTVSEEYRKPNQYYIPNGISGSSVAQIEKENLNNDKIRLLMVGRLSDEKNHALAIDAFKKISTSIPEVELRFAGDGPLKDALKAIAIDSCLESKITFLGFVKEIESEIVNSDLILMPSKTEGLPITLLEAMKLHVPVIASKVGAIPDVLNDNPAFLLNKTSSDELAKSVINWFNLDASQKRTLLKSNFETFQSRFTAEAMGKAYESIYKQLLQA